MRFAPPAALLLFALACGGAQATQMPQTGSPLSPEERMLFEDGVDFVGDPAVLEGRWRDDWSRELDERVTEADVVSVVRVRTLRTDTDLDRRTTYRLLVEEIESIIGELPEDVVLPSTEGDGGYETIAGNEPRVLDEEFVLFLKWQQENPGDPVRPRWHLSPHTEHVTERVKYLAEHRRGVERERPNTTVIVHEAED